MSVLPLQTVVMNGQHLVISSLPLPSRPSWLLVLNGHFDRVFDGGGPEAKGWFY